MAINWYPGHMAKSIRMIEESLKMTSVVVYVLDSRAPYSCLNPSFDKLIKNKRILYLLNKSDMADKKKLEDWLKFFNTGNNSALALNSTISGSGKIVLSKLKTLYADKIRASKERGFVKSIKVMVIGIPNSGKSTLINNLCGKSKALTGDKAGVTRGKQWIKVSDEFDFLDTPGTLYPKLEDLQTALRLAYIGSINDNILDIYEITESLIAELIALYPDCLKERYNIKETDGSIVNTLSQIAVQRGCLKKDHDLDLEAAAKIVLYDFRKGRLGHITFEKAEDYDKRTI